jgi:SAM-dependent methyltransferase
LFRIPERELGVLVEPAGASVVELGCGTAYLSAWLAKAGAHPIGVDLSSHQLGTARSCQARFGPAFPLIEADAGAVPLRSAAFDLVVAEYGAAPWAEPQAWVTEAARLLRPGGRLVFLTNSVLVGLCVPAEGGFAGDRLLRSSQDMEPVTWPGGGVEHHPGHGAWIRLLRRAGFVIDALHELHAPPGARTHEDYEIVTAAWAQRWPAEDLWVAHLQP